MAKKESKATTEFSKKTTKNSQPISGLDRAKMAKSVFDNRLGMLIGIDTITGFQSVKSWQSSSGLPFFQLNPTPSRKKLDSATHYPAAQ